MKELAPYWFQGFFILGIGFICAFFPRAPQLAVVDMNALISTGSQSLAKSGRISSHEVQEWGNRMKEGLEAFGEERQLVMLSKGAVVGNALPDVTEEVLSFIAAEEK